MKIQIAIAKDIVLDREDLRDIKKNPKGWANSLYLSDLVNILKTANKAYHNTGSSQLTDAQYDILLDELRERKPNHSFLKKAGATPEGPAGRKKVKLPYSLFSLDKIKPFTESFTKWVSTHKGPYIVSDKEDGLSIEVIYDDGIPHKAYTRGNGTVGQDVSHLIPHLGVPLSIPYRKHFVTRQEAAMTEAAFQQHFSKETSKTTGKKYENARNLVAGVVNTLNKRHEALDHIHSITYEIIEPRMKPSEALALLKKYKFNVVPYKVFDSLNEDDLVRYLKQRKAKSPVGIDGLVIEQDKKTTRPIAGNPDYAVAFKAEQEGDVVEAEVLGVEWEESQYGTLKPVVQIKPVRLAGVTVKQASGFNAKFIETGYRLKDAKGKHARPIGPGAVIKIKRSGEVIPHIIEVVTPAKKPDMPTVDYTHTNSGVDIKLAVDSSLVKAKRITRFFTEIDIENIKLGTVQKLMDAGYDSILKIIKAKPADFLNVEGFQQRSAQKLYDSIQDKTSKPIKLSILMKASGHFGMGMGERRIDEILKVHPDILDIYAREGEEHTLHLVTQIPGFQEKTAMVFVRGIPGYAKWFVKSKLKTIIAEQVKKTGSSLKGQAIGFTGFRSKELEDKIKANSGIITPGVTKETTILLVANTSTTSSKAEKARRQGTKIMSADDFIKQYKL